MKDLCFTNLTTLRRMVEVENERQIKKWGVQDHEPFEWLGFATEELGETAQAIAEWQFRHGSREEVVEEAIQTATLMLKIAEMFMHRVELVYRD